MTAALRVSVIVPCRNGGPWLTETLESVRPQLTPGIDELIVVDDGSEDDSADIAAAFGAHVHRGPARGVSEARTLGASVARGRYFLYLDADDVLEPGTIEARIRRIEETDADVVLTAWRSWVPAADGSWEFGPVRQDALGPRPELDILRGAWWPPGAVLYRRTAVERIGPWRVDLPVIQDARYLLDAALCGCRFVQLAEPGLRYRVRPDSLSRRDPAAFLRDCYRNAADVHDQWLRDGAIDDERREALLNVIGNTARGLYVIDQALFEEAYGRLRSLDPHYRPARPAALRMLSGLVGYRRAEWMALRWRQVKGRLA